MITNYFNFISGIPLNENVNAANAFMHKRFLSKVQEKDPTIKSLTPEEKKQAEKDAEYQKVKALVGDKLGFLFLFVRLYFDGIPIDELRQRLMKLEEFKKYLKDLPMNIDQYASMEPTETDKRSRLERLDDALGELDIQRSIDLFIKGLPGEFVVKREDAEDVGAVVPSFRNAARNATTVQKEKIREIAISFQQMGKSLKEREILQKIFYFDCLRYRSLNELIIHAQEYIEASNNSSVVDLLMAINKVNNLYGIENGAEILCNVNNVVVFEVKSFHANVIINANTAHCIKDNYRDWLSYVSGEGIYNKQYYVWNFNLLSSDNKRIFGVTIYPNGKVRAAHWKDDQSISNVEDYVNKTLKIKFEEYFKPMNKSEVDIKKVRDRLNKEIIASDITIEKMKELLDQGADPNVKDGELIKRAVKANNPELLKFLISKGAKVTIGRPIDVFQYNKTLESLNTLLTLVKSGAIIEFNKILRLLNDVEILKVMIENGLDVSSGKFLVPTISQNSIESVKILLDNGAPIVAKGFESLKLALSLERTEIAELMINKLVKQNVIIAKEDFKKIMAAADTSNEDIKKLLNYLKQLVK